MRVEVDFPIPTTCSGKECMGYHHPVGIPLGRVTIPSSALVGEKSSDGEVYVLRNGHAKLVPITLARTTAGEWRYSRD